jgi:heme/copper-type cytochrome/quinol oxidase subunit 4
MIQVYTVGALLLIAFTLIGIWMTLDAKKDKK